MSKSPKSVPSVEIRHSSVGILVNTTLLLMLHQQLVTKVAIWCYCGIPQNLLFGKETYKEELYTYEQELN